MKPSALEPQGAETVQKAGIPASFYNTKFVYFPLPTKNIGAVWKQVTPSGSIAMLSSPSVPFGLFGRLALVALMNLSSGDEKEVIFSPYDILKKIRLAKPTGLQLDKFLKQLVYWASVSITIIYKHPGNTRIDTHNLVITEDSSISLIKDTDDKATLSGVRFSERGLKFLSMNAFPVPQDAISSIRSAADFDILSWMISSIYQLKEDSQPRFVTWDSIISQFNVSKPNIARFKNDFGATIFDLKSAYYPEAKIVRYHDGISLSPSPLLVPEKNLVKVPSFKFTEEQP